MAGPEIIRQFCIHEDPASTVEPIAQMIDFDDGCGQFASIVCAPNDGIEASGDGAGRSASMIEIDCAQANHRAERVFPGEAWNLERQVRICLKLQTFRPRRGLVLIDHERSRESHAVVAQMPPVGVTIGRAGEGPSSDHQKISAAL